MCVLEQLPATLAFNFGPVQRLFAAVCDPKRLAFVLRSSDRMRYFKLMSPVRRCLDAEGSTVGVHFTATAIPSVADLDVEYVGLMLERTIIREKNGISLLRETGYLPQLDFVITVE